MPSVAPKGYPDVQWLENKLYFHQEVCTERKGVVMLTQDILRFMERTQLAFAATSDGEGRPHLAAGRVVKPLDGGHLALENWFCRSTLANIARNPRMAVVVVEPDTGNGYQFLGTVEQVSDSAMLDGLAPGEEQPGIPQVLSRIVVRIEKVFAFSAGVHTDIPLDR